MTKTYFVIKTRAFSRIELLYLSKTKYNEALQGKNEA